MPQVYSIAVWVAARYVDWVIVASQLMQVKRALISRMWLL